MRVWTAATAGLVAAIALLSAAFAFAVVEESGYACGDLPIASVYRLLPWGRAETIVFWGHVALYPVAVVIGAQWGRLSRRGSARPGRATSVVATAMILGIGLIVPGLVQAPVTTTFMHLDACGSAFYGGGAWFPRILLPAGFGIAAATGIGRIAFSVQAGLWDRSPQTPVPASRP